MLNSAIKYLSEKETLEWRKNNSYFYFPSLISNCVIYSMKKYLRKIFAKQKIFRGRSKALKISIFSIIS